MLRFLFLCLSRNVLLALTSFYYGWFLSCSCLCHCLLLSWWTFVFFFLRTFAFFIRFWWCLFQLILLSFRLLMMWAFNWLSFLFLFVFLWLVIAIILFVFRFPIVVLGVVTYSLDLFLTFFLTSGFLLIVLRAFIPASKLHPLLGDYRLKSRLSLTHSQQITWVFVCLSWFRCIFRMWRFCWKRIMFLLVFCYKA